MMDINGGSNGRKFDLRLAISGANFITLIGLLVTAVSTYSAFVSNMARNDVTLQNVQTQMARLEGLVDREVISLRLWREEVIKRLAIMENSINRLEKENPR